MATIIEFPARGPSPFALCATPRLGSSYVVTMVGHGDYRTAIADAKEIARGFGVAVQVAP